MSQRIYLAQHGEHKHLVRAATPASVRNHIAKEIIRVEVASPDDIYSLAKAGVPVQDTRQAPVQLEVGE